MIMKKILNSELNRLTVDEFKVSDKCPVVVVADNIRSLHNVGALFRTCDAFAVEKVWLCGVTATPPNKEIHKTALGAELSVEWEYSADTLSVVSDLKSQGYRVLAVEQVEGSASLDNFVAEEGMRYALVFGNEVKGVSQDAVSLCDGAVEIPQIGTKHSLNVSVSVGVVLWEFFKQLRIR